MYADLRRFSDADWRFLASAFQWARHNAATLSHTELLPGDPLKGEPYGLAHFTAVAASCRFAIRPFNRRRFK